MLGLLMCSEPRILTYPGEKKRWEVSGHSELERRLLCLPLQGQINPTGDQRLCGQVWWMITLDDRLDDLRREKGEPNQPADIVFGEALALPDLGHRGHLSRYVEAHTDF